MESRFLGIPLAIWVLVIGLALLVDVPGFMWHNAVSDQLSSIEYQVRVVNQKPVLTPTASPTASPSATVSPTMKFEKVFVKPTASPTP